MAATSTMWKSYSRIRLFSRKVSKIRSNITSEILANRFLFTDEKLGIDGFQKRQLFVKDNIGNLKDGFMSRMKNLVEENETLPVFPQDLGSVIHISETDEDLELLEKLLKRVVSKWEDMESPYKFGPVVMRLLHTLKKDDLALKLNNDEALVSSFQMMTSKLVLLDLLYECGRHSEVVDIFQQIKDEQVLRNLRDIRTIACLSQYKLNNKEGLDCALDDLYATLKSSTDFVSGRTIEVISAMALKQGKEETALNVASYLNRRTQTCINIQVSAYSRLDRVEDALLLLNFELKNNNPSTGSYRNKIFLEAIADIEEAIKRKSQPELEARFLNVKSALQSGNFLSETTIDREVTKPVQTRPSNLRKRPTNDSRVNQRQIPQAVNAL